MGWDLSSRVNVNGGAIAIGHPIGGIRLPAMLVTLLL
jgi:acetyl-CoA acetyltransferase